MALFSNLFSNLLSKRFSKLIPNSTSRLSTKSAKRRLFLSLTLFLLCLTLPMGLLLDRVYQQFRVEMFYQYRESAEGVLFQINEAFNTMILKEENRPFVDYQFYKVAESPLLKQKGIELSPLSRLNTQSEESGIPGLIGYFQIDPDSTFSTPILPVVDQALLTAQSLPIEQSELNQRLRLQDDIKLILLNANLLNSDAGRELTSDHPIEQALPPSLTPKSANRQAPALKSTQAYTEEENRASENKIEKRAAKTAVVKQNIKKTVSKKKLVDLSLDDSFSQETTQTTRQQARQPRKENILTAPASSDIFMEQAQQQTQRISNIDALSERRRLGSDEPVAESESESELELELDEEIALSDSVISVMGEIDPIQMQQLESGHYIFYRRVWREKQRYIQGFIVDAETLLNTWVKPIFLRGNFDDGLTLIAGYEGVISTEYHFEQRDYRDFSKHYSNTVSQSLPQAPSSSLSPPMALPKSTQTDHPHKPDNTILIYRNTLLDPFDKLDILITANHIPLGPGIAVINGLVVMIAVILMAGFYGLYRLGVKQIALAEERLNFVSSVSHELKTPLTSILMYGEMLREGMVPDEEKRKTYYDFIYYESERLSRLISNILQLSHHSRNRSTLNLSKTSLSTAIDLARSKISTLIDRHGFQLTIDASIMDASIHNISINNSTNIDSFETDTRTYQILIDPDAFCQIVINLVDNAIKFSADAERKEVVIGFRLPPSKKGKLENKIGFYVRDFGQGVPKSQSKKVFELFYRVGSEMTRTTPGTGIGLALVSTLTHSMDGYVDLINCEPGSEFVVYFPMNR